MANAVVVVLPWVPATATTVPGLTHCPSASARLTTGMPRSRAARTSGLDGLMAEETTSAETPSR